MKSIVFAGFCDLCNLGWGTVLTYLQASLTGPRFLNLAPDVDTSETIFFETTDNLRQLRLYCSL